MLYQKYSQFTFSPELNRLLEKIEFQLVDWFAHGPGVSQIDLETAIKELEKIPLTEKDSTIEERLKKLQIIFGKSTDSVFDFSNIH
jgi:hypothetical protein